MCRFLGGGSLSIDTDTMCPVAPSCLSGLGAGSFAPSEDGRLFSVLGWAPQEMVELTDAAVVPLLHTSEGGEFHWLASTGPDELLFTKNNGTFRFNLTVGRSAALGLDLVAEEAKPLDDGKLVLAGFGFEILDEAFAPIASASLDENSLITQDSYPLAELPLGFHPHVATKDGGFDLLDQGRNLVWSVDTESWVATRFAGCRDCALDASFTSCEGLIGTATAGYSGDGGPALDARFACPEGIAVGPDGAVYIADTANGCIRVVHPDGIVDRFAAECSASQYLQLDGEGGPALDAHFPGVWELAVADGFLYLLTRQPDTSPTVVERIRLE